MSKITTYKNRCPHQVDARSRKFRERRIIKRDLKRNPIKELEKLFDKKETETKEYSKEYSFTCLEKVFKVKLPPQEQQKEEEIFVGRDIVNKLFAEVLKWFKSWVGDLNSKTINNLKE